MAGTVDSKTGIVSDVLAIRERWHTKRHPFFGALGEGKLPLRVLGIYMAMHWQFVQRALASFGILFTRTFSHEDVRKMIVENLAEEEGLKAIPREGHVPHDHGELIFRFCRAAGLSEPEVRTMKMTPAWWGRSLHYYQTALQEPIGVVLAAEEVGVYREEGLEAHVELLPSLDAVNALRDGAVDFVAGGAHTTLLAFPQWKGAKLVVTLSQGTPWLLVVHADLPARRGDIGAVKGLRIGAAPGPDRAFLHLLAEVGIDPARHGVTIGPVPGALDPGASFGVVAADALERRLVDGFWANALGSETAVRRGVGKVSADVRRGDGP